jgi:hypothetical protein
MDLNETSLSLGEMQRKFVLMVAQLIAWAYKNGRYELTFGEAYRTPEQAAINAKTGAGIADSLHCDRLAVDFNLFKDGVYQTDTSAYEPLGVFWESIGGSWGGRFVLRPDGNHFSLAWDGKR